MPKRTTPANGQTAWALAVVSSEGQAETLVHQRAWAKETCESHGWRLTRVIEGVSSGKAGPRRTVRDLLADLKALDPAARPKRLLMIRADRLGRGSVIESQIALRDLHELGVSVWTRDQGEVKLDSAMDELISAATLAVARHENDVRSDKMRQVRIRKRAAGERMGTIPYGLARGTDGRDAADGERAKIVEHAFAMRLAGNGYQSIGRWLALNAPPMVYRAGPRVQRWTNDRVADMLRQRAYVGPIIDEATFARAQRVAATLTKTRKGPERRHYWPLSGTLKCYCNRGLIGSESGMEPWRIRYYVCRARWNHDGNFKLYRSEKLEEQFVELLDRLRASPDLIERYSRRAGSPVSTGNLERSMRELKAKLANVEQRREAAWELHAAGKVRAQDVQERLDKLAIERDKLQGSIAEANEQLSVAKVAAGRTKDVEALIRRAASIFRRATVAEQNQIARAVALEFGGFHVNEHGRLKPGKPSGTAG